MSTHDPLVYALVDPRTDEIRYIGKSIRGLERPRNGNYCGYCRRWINTLKREGLNYRIEVIQRCEKTVLASAEIAWISLCRAIGCPLTNLSDGGEGMLNPAPEVREKMKQAHRGLKHTEESKLKIALSKLGKPRPDVAELGRRNRGRKASLGTRALIAAAGRGRTHRPETIAKMQASAKRRRRDAQGAFI